MPAVEFVRLAGDAGNASVRQSRAAARPSGTSWTWPSVIMMAPANRSGGMSDRALREVGEQLGAIRSRRRGRCRNCDPTARRDWGASWPLPRAAFASSVRGRDRRSPGSGCRRPAREHVVEGFAILVLSDTDWRARAAAGRQPSAARARRAHRAREDADSTTPIAPQWRAAAAGTKREERDRPAMAVLLSETLEQAGHMHLIGLVVAGERVHHEIDADAKGHSRCNSPPGTAG